MLIYDAGDPGSPLTSVTGAPVNIVDIQAKYNKDNLFVDPDFPPNSNSLGQVGGDSSAASGSASKTLEWKRPFEITNQYGMPPPKFAALTDALSSTPICSEADVLQGGLGDCWYLVAIAALTKRIDQLDIVIPEDNFYGFNDDKYCGAFHFRFYDIRHGKWVDVVVDDHLPCKASGKYWFPAFTKIFPGNKISKSTQTEFWPALIEKAYAKFIGSYHLIEGGEPCQALEDLTGGFGEAYALSSQPIGAQPLLYADLKAQLEKIMSYNNFCGLTTYTPDLAAWEGCLEGYTYYGGKGKSGYLLNRATVELTTETMGLGLCPQHAYTILDAQEIKTKDGNETKYLVKIRNPHARHEWCGNFGDSDDEGWSRMEKDLRKRNQLGSTELDDGEFWMDLLDMKRYFKELQACYFGLSDGTKSAQAFGSWPAELQSKSLALSNASLMHCSAFKFTLKRELNIERPTDDSGDECVAAFQLVLHVPRSTQGPIFMFYLYKVEESELADLPKVYNYGTPALVSSMAANTREVNKWSTFVPGTYILVPLLQTSLDKTLGGIPLPTELQGKDIPFTVRLFSENQATIEEIPPQPPAFKSPTIECQCLLAQLIASLQKGAAKC